MSSRKRAFHSRTKTGCFTCRIRRVRCDEEKPNCSRCVSTGRKCDGYISQNNSSDIRAPSLDSGIPKSMRSQHLVIIPQSPAIPLPKKNDQELRCGRAAILSFVLLIWIISREEEQAFIFRRKSHHTILTLLLCSFKGNCVGIGDINALVIDAKHKLHSYIDQELRSYRFFLDVSVSALSGVFDDDFWRIDIPRTCHSDAAIWHAVVSLGAAHELYVTQQTTPPTRRLTTTAFAVRQYNEAVRQLLHVSFSQDLQQKKWRAVIASVLFTYLCGIQGLHDQATIHLNAAEGLLKELQQPNRGRPGESTLVITPSYLRVNSVPYSTVLSMVANLEIQAQALHSPNASKTPHFFSDVQPYIAWRYYTAPTGIKSCQHGRCDTSRATPAALLSAGRACQSLLDALIRLSQEDGPDYDRLIKGIDSEKVAESLEKRKQACTRAFWELDKSIANFIRNTESQCACSSVSPGKALLPSSEVQLPMFEQSKTAIDALRVFHAICYLLLYGNSSGAESSSLRSKLLIPHVDVITSISTMLNVADQVLQSQKALKQGSSSSHFIPRLSVAQPLFAVAVNGPTLTLRRRAIKLLGTYRRRDGLWDTGLIASVAKVFLDREIFMAEDMERRNEAQQAPEPFQHQIQRGKRIWGLDKTLDGTRSIPPDCQVRWAVLTFIGSFSARIEMKTLSEWVANEPGWETSLKW